MRTARSKDRRTKRSRRSVTQYRTAARSDITAADHLWIQHQIERQAYQLWNVRGCPASDGLNDWLRAEREVLARFCLEQMNRQLPSISKEWRR